ncbi:MAG: hypothetical protein M1834_004477 [Cirrosporium novae-zelandiae]|nr:MAG: hypothetical protein M1834_004477 [Cirrosporium novae-zelandiae]
MIKRLTALLLLRKIKSDIEEIQEERNENQHYNYGEQNIGEEIVPVASSQQQQSPHFQSTPCPKANETTPLLVSNPRPSSLSPPPPPQLSAWWIENKGVVLVLLAELFSALMNTTARLLQTAPSPSRDGTKREGMHTFQILFARMSVTCLFSTAYLWYRNVPNFLLGAQGVRGLLVFRGTAGFIGIYGFYYSLRYLAVAEATIITFLVPILTSFACALVLYMPFPRAEQLAAIISFMGVIIIAHPISFLKPESPTNVFLFDINEPPPVTPSQRVLATFLALVSVFGATAAYTIIRLIGSRAHPLISVNYFSMVTTVISCFSLVSIPSIGFQLPYDGREWFLLTSIGVCGFLLQYLLTAGLLYDKSSRATNMIYMQEVFALLLDRVIWGSWPDTMSMLGGSVVLTSVIYVAVRKQATEIPVVKDEENRLLEEEQ